MPRPKKLREPGDTQVRKAWNKKKTRKYTIAITLDERGEAQQETATKKTTAKKTTKASAKKTPARSPASSARPPARARRSAAAGRLPTRRNAPAELRAQAAPAERSTTAPALYSVPFR